MAIYRWIINDVNPGSEIFLLNAVSFFLLVLRMVYFFGMFREYSKFYVILMAVFGKLFTFFTVFFIIIFVFLIPFMMFNQQQNGERDYIFGQEIPKLSMMFPAFNTIYMSSIGEYGFTEPFNEDPSGFSKWICWVLFVISTVLIQLIMLNLIIAIIGATYEEVLEELEASIYLSRARLVVDNIHWVHSLYGKNKIIEQRNKRNWLVSAEPYNYKK
jgi:hypothetical protein